MTKQNSKKTESEGYRESAVITYLSQRGFRFTREQLGEPFGGYKDFADCVSQNSDKGDPHAYCGYIKHKVEDDLNIERQDLASKEQQDVSFVQKNTRPLGTKEATKNEFTTYQDSKVCPQCEALEGNVYYEDDNKPELPIHPNCRCYYEVQPYVPNNGKQSSQYIFRRERAAIGETNRLFLEGSLKVVESLQAASFSWSDIGKLKELASKKKGKFLLVEGIHPMVTDSFNMGHGAREWTEGELLRSTRTAIGKGMNINHTIQLNPMFEHRVMDAEFNDLTKTSELILYEEDPEILELIRQGYIEKVSMQGMPRRSLTKCDSCGTAGCSCKTVPEGVVFGEDDGQALAYVVTREGARYRGKLVPAEQPGDWNTSIRIVETNKNSSLGNIAIFKGLVALSKNKLVPITRSQLAEAVPAGAVQEALKINEEKFVKLFVVKEDLQSFNDALASGDAVKAVSILANDLYRQMPAMTQSMPAPYPQDPNSVTGMAPTGTQPGNPPPTKKNEDASGAGQGVGGDANGMMPQQKKQESEGDDDDGDESSSDNNKKMKKEMVKESREQPAAPVEQTPEPEQKAKELEQPMPESPKTNLTDDLNGDTRYSVGAPKKQTIPDEGIGTNDNMTMKTSEAIKELQAEVAKLKDSIKSLETLKESMRNLSSQVAQYQQESVRHRINPGQQVRETLNQIADLTDNINTPIAKPIDIEKVRERLAALGTQ